MVSPVAEELVFDAVWKIGFFGVRKCARPVLSDFSHGGFGFYRDGMPEFYCVLFSADGKPSELAKVIRDSTESAADVIVKLMLPNEFGSVPGRPSNGLQLPFFGTSTQLRSVRAIIDCSESERA